MQTAMYVMPIFHWELSLEDILGAGPQSRPLPFVFLDKLYLVSIVKEPIIIVWYSCILLFIHKYMTIY